MWLRCRNWVTWRRWVWVPVAVTVIVAFATTSLLVADAERTAAQEQAAMCTSARAQLESMTATHESLLDEAWNLGAAFVTEHPTDWRPRAGAPKPSTRDWTTGAELVRPDVWGFYASNDGRSWRDIAEFKSEFERVCATE